MDIVILLLFMAIFYLGPALLKRYHAAETRQPVAIKVQRQEIINPPLQTLKHRNTDSATKLRTSVTDQLQIVPTIIEEKNQWNGKLDSNMILNGVIFAEILLPPRAYRPFTKK